MGNAQVGLASKTVDTEHPDVIKASMDAIHSDIRQQKELRLKLMDDYDNRKFDYIEYIGEDRLEEVEQDSVWKLAIEPTFTRVYMRSKESKALRDMAAAWKKLHNLDDYLLQKERDLEEMNDRLARSLSLKSTHGLLRETMRQRDMALDDREAMRLELESAIALAKTNIMKRLNDSPHLILRLTEWNLSIFLPGPDVRHRESGRQERTVSGLVVEPSSNVAFLDLLKELAAHKGMHHQYGFAITKSDMLTAQWGFVDPMPFHGQHFFQGRSESIYEDVHDIKPDEAILLGFHYNRYRTNVVQTGTFKLPETTFDHYPDRKEFEDILGLMSKIYEVPGYIAQLYTESSKKPTCYCLKVIRIAV
jgi:hypothetical protein